ncbi:flavin reductase family protein [Tenacibaculum ovolyticum]|uniref:flavin reductase family protein n=1 Tax=Tenacibaculum ovolyticum TaxID=104270 RepID=UPI003BACC491
MKTIIQKYTKQDLENLDKLTRLKIVNGITGIKPANLIATIDNDGNTNVAIFSSVVHLGSNPPLLGFVTKLQMNGAHTFQNIKQNGVYTINHIHPEFTEQAHYTAASFDKNTSEFERCGLTEEYIDNFKAPFVKESEFKMGMCFKEAITIPSNEATLVVGEIESIMLPDCAMVNGDINLEEAESVGISGLNSYYEVKKIANYPYAKVEEVPKFK